MQSPLKLMCIIAHPDDESLAMGGTLAKYAREGIETSLVVATRGERGWRGSADEHPGEAVLGTVREKELREASSVLGVSHLAFLDYVDGDLDQAEYTEIVPKIVTLLRILRPHVIITFGPDGLYGHPDHIAISQYTCAAVLCAADPGYPLARHITPHVVSKLYYRVATKQWFADYMPVFGELVMRINGVERRATSWDDWAITTRIATGAFWRTVWQAVCCHRTQVPDYKDVQHLTEGDHKKLWGSQEYYRAFSLVNGGKSEELDLFEGLWS